jgi:hypothetical protein
MNNAKKHEEKKKREEKDSPYFQIKRQPSKEREPCTKEFIILGKF